MEKKTNTHESVPKKMRGMKDKSWNGEWSVTIESDPFSAAQTVMNSISLYLLTVAPRLRLPYKAKQDRLSRVLLPFAP